MQEENMTTPENTQATDSVFYSHDPVEQQKVGNKRFFTFNTIVNIILLIGLIVLYILFFTSKKSADELPQASMALQKSGGKSLSVVFVNIDSLNLKYDFVKLLRNDLESTGKRLQAEVLAEQSAFEKEAADFQKQVASNSIAEDKAKIIYESLMQKQQALVEKKDRFTQQVSNQELDMNLRLLDTVTNFLKRYNRIYKFDYILAHKTAGDILIANDTLDITSDVIKVLNKEYQSRKK
jgi:outer membrane protein